MRIHLGFFYRNATGKPSLKLRLTMAYRPSDRFFRGRVRSNEESHQTSAGGASLFKTSWKLFCQQATRGKQIEPIRWKEKNGMNYKSIQPTYRNIPSKVTNLTTSLTPFSIHVSFESWVIYWKFNQYWAYTNDLNTALSLFPPTEKPDLKDYWSKERGSTFRPAQSLVIEMASRSWRREWIHKLSVPGLFCKLFPQMLYQHILFQVPIYVQYKVSLFFCGY